MTSGYQKQSPADLRKFGFIFSGVLALIFGILIPTIKQWSGFGSLFSSFEHWPIWPWVVALAVMVWALVHPRSLFLLHRPWMKFADVAGWVNTRVIMLVLFYFLIMPIGFLMRLFGHDPMSRKFNKALDSYRVKSKPQDRDHMETPY